MLIFVMIALSKIAVWPLQAELQAENARLTNQPSLLRPRLSHRRAMRRWEHAA
jgi:hypothetical protein